MFDQKSTVYSPLLCKNERIRAIGMLPAGLDQNVVAKRIDVYRNTIGSFWRRFQQSNIY